MSNNFDIKRKAKPDNLETGKQIFMPPAAAKPAENRPSQISQENFSGTAGSRAFKSAWIFKKSFILVGFTVLVLVLGTVLGSRFIKLASSVSVGSNNANVYQNISNAISAVLSNSFQGLKNLDQNQLAQAIRGNQRVNILLLGYGGSGHDGAYLTDTMMVLSINFATKKAALISIPRDTWTKIPTNGTDGSFWKINAAYELGLDDSQYPNKLPQFAGNAGGGNLAKYEVSKILGIPIDYFVAIDFNAFQKIVDDLGGVTINVDNSFTDYSYPESDQTADGAWCLDTGVQTTPQPSNCRYKEVHFDAGIQFMDGTRALEYVRSRHAAGVEGNDFARNKRQQKLLAAIQQKILSSSAVPKILQLATDIQGHFSTDMSLAEIDDLSAYTNKIDLNSAQKISIVDNNLLIVGTSADGQYILTPSAGPENFSAIQAYIFNILNASQP